MAKHKTYAKSRGFSVLHACGHSGSHRLNLEWFAGLEINSIVDEKIESLLQENIRVRSLEECPTCLALSDYIKSRDAIIQISSAVGLPAPDELRGTARQKAWGESIRFTAYRSLFENAVLSMIEQPVAISLLTEILNNHQSKMSDEFVLLLRRMRKVLRDIAPIYYQSATDEQLLAAFGLIRYVLHNSSVLRQPIEAKRWMMWGKYRRHEITKLGSDTSMPSGVIAAAFIAASLCRNDNVNSLVGLVDFLTNRADAVDPATLQHYLATSHDIKESLDNLQVHKAL